MTHTHTLTLTLTLNMCLYLDRYGYTPRLISEPPDANLEIVVVIPCYAEPDLIDTLQSLAACQSIKGKTEIIIVVNQSTADPPDILDQNLNTLKEIENWRSNQNSDLEFYALHQTLPAKHAGVGLARKIGMDEAYRRFADLKKDGIIACLDADCLCKNNYLSAIQQHFLSNPSTPGCSIYFEHPLDDSASQAIAAYELHLRYYTHALRYCGLPCAFQTVGSSMAVRASAYAKQGGMNKRKAGEDFYFLQKIIKLGNFTELNHTVVYPSSRISHRVPFGTGKAMAQYLASNASQFKTYHPNTFVDLRQLAGQIPALYQSRESGQLAVWESFTPALQGFIPKEKFTKLIDEFNYHTSSFPSFEKRFFQWCDGFLAFKFSNYARDDCYPAVDVAEAAIWLLRAAYVVDAAGNDVMELLMKYRLLDKKN